MSMTTRTEKAAHNSHSIQRAYRTISRFASFTVLAASLAGCSKNEEQVEKRSAPKSTWTPPTVLIQPSDTPPYPTAPLPVQTTPKPTISAEIPKTTQRSSKGCDSSMVRITNFCIDQYEVHLIDMKTLEVHPYNHVPPEMPVNLKAVSEEGVYPQGHMSQRMANVACRNAGKRLCTMKEWMLACQGNEGLTFPYGNEAQEGACNVNRSPYVMSIFFPKVQGDSYNLLMFNDSRLLRYGFLAKTGEYKKCVSPFGVHDMDGNLSEWVVDTEKVGSERRGIFKGEHFHGRFRGCSHGATAHMRKYYDYSIGTRCCANAKD